MKQQEFYEAPTVEIVDCRVEAGFGVSQIESVKPEGEIDWD